MMLYRRANRRCSLPVLTFGNGIRVDTGVEGSRLKYAVVLVLVLACGVGAGFAAGWYAQGTSTKTLVIKDVVKEYVVTKSAGTTTAAATPVATSAAPIQGITTGAMEQNIEQGGLTFSGVRYTTLYAGCSGQGFPGPDSIDPKFNVEQPTYVQFPLRRHSPRLADQ